jgi:hypothetical protein
MVKDESIREQNAGRVRKYRKENNLCNGHVTVGNEEEVEVKAFEVDVGFEFKDKDAALIYGEYPRKIGRGAALKAIKQAFMRLTNGKESPPGLTLTRGDATMWMIQRTRLYAMTPAGNAGEYTPHPSTWFNESRYLDDESEWSKGGTEASKSQERSNTRRRNLVNAFASQPCANDGRSSREREGGTINQSEHRMESSVRKVSAGSD